MGCLCLHVECLSVLLYVDVLVLLFVLVCLFVCACSFVALFVVFVLLSYMFGCVCVRSWLFRFVRVWVVCVFVCLSVALVALVVRSCCMVGCVCVELIAMICSCWVVRVLGVVVNGFA